MRTEFWSDAVVGPLADSIKLFYIGLWQVADDAGWLYWAPRQIAALLYPYKPAKRREADVEKWLAMLADLGRVTLYDCGCVAVTNLQKHQRVSGVQSFRAKEKHDSEHVTPHVLTTTQSPLSDSPVKGGNVTVGVVEEGWGEPEGPALTWLAQRGCAIRPGDGYHRHLVTATEHHGIQALLSMFERLEKGGMKRGDTKGYVFGAIDALNAKARPDLKALEAKERDEEERQAHRNRLEATKRRIAELQEPA